MRSLLLVIIVALISISCVDSDRIRKVLKPNSPAAMPVMKSGNEEFLSKVEKIVRVEDVSIGFESGTKNGKSFLGFTIQIKDPSLNLEEEQKAQSLTDEIERVVNQEILNLNEFDLYKVIFTSMEVDGPFEKRRQIIITKML